MKSNFITGIVTTVLVVLMITCPAQAQQAKTTRTELQRHDLSIPGQEAVQARIDFDSGSSVSGHKHPGEEIIYVLKGSLQYTVEGKPPVTLKAGEVLFIPAGTVHAAKNVGKGKASELATYIVEKGKPLVQFVDEKPKAN